MADIFGYSLNNYVFDWLFVIYPVLLRRFITQKFVEYRRPLTRQFEKHIISASLSTIGSSKAYISAS